MKVLVTGASGMLANALLPQLAAAGHDVTPLAHAALDVTDYDALLTACRRTSPDWVFHLAAFTKVDACEERPEEAFLINGLGARTAALAAAACGAAVLSLSTDYVFDGRGSRPYRVHDAAAPQSVYGHSKWAGEQAVRDVHPRHIIVRTAWLFGAGGLNFIDAILARAENGQPLAVVDDQQGSPTWTSHLAGQLIRLAARGQFGSFHCTNSGTCTWHELAEHVLSARAIEAAVARISTAELGRPAPRPAYSVLDNHWTEHVTGFKMPHWRDAVAGYLAERPAPASTARRP